MAAELHAIRSGKHFAGSPTRSSAAQKLGPIIGPVWAEPVRLAVTPIARRDPRRARVLLGPFVWAEEGGHPAARETQRTLSCFPVVSHGLVLFIDGEQIRAVDFSTGLPALTGRESSNRRRLFQLARIDCPRRAAAYVDRCGRRSLRTRWPVGYGAAGIRGNTPGDRLIGLDLNREGTVSFSRAAGGWNMGVRRCTGERRAAAIRGHAAR